LVSITWTPNDSVTVEAMVKTIQSGLPTLKSTMIGTIMAVARTLMRAPTTKKTGRVSKVIFRGSRSAPVLISGSGLIQINFRSLYV
jgi:hypothetical protein